MPNRILRDGILTSERVNQLGTAAEVFYRRLMSVVDDFGRFDARPSVLRTSCYPLRVDVVREADISLWLTEVQRAGLIVLYSIDRKDFLQVIDWRQQIRAKHSKWPAPPPDVQSICTAHANHMQAYAQHMHTKTESKTESKTNTETEFERNIPRRVMPMAQPDKPPAAAHPTVDAALSEEDPEAPVNHPPFEAVLKHFEKCSDYSREEIRMAFTGFQAIADPAGNWFWGKRLVSDWRGAMETRMADNRSRNPNAMTAKKADRLLKEIENA